MKSKKSQGLDAINKTGVVAPAKGDWPPKSNEPRKGIGEWPTDQTRDYYRGRRMRA